MRTLISFVIVVFLLPTLNVTTSVAQDSAVYMYWTDGTTNKIQRANLDGTNVQDLITGLVRPIGIALDLAGGKMYWTDRDKPHHADPAGRNSIHRANLNGTNIETLVLGGNSVKEYIALDISGGKMYWTEYSHFSNNHKIQRANLDGSNVEDIVTGLIHPRGIALDVTDGKIYWASWGSGKIQRANVDGSNIEELVGGLSRPFGIALDSLSGKIYWTNLGSSKIQRANLDGTSLEDLIGGLQKPSGITVDPAGGKIYWTAHGTGKIQRANLDGSHVEDLFTTGSPSGVALGIPQTPVLRLNPNVIADQTFTLGVPASFTLPMAIGGTPPYTYRTSALPSGLQFDPVDRWLNGTPTTLVNAHPVTYTATDATGASASLTFTITVQTTYGTDVYMYWTDHGTNKLQRANLDGTNVRDIVTGSGRPVGIALDLAGGKMYWTDRDRRHHTDPAGRNSIHRANLDGTNVETLVLGGNSVKECIALDVSGGKMYWTEYSHFDEGKVQRANLDGSNVENLVTNIPGAIGIALDLSQGKIYWTNAGKLRRANLDGSDIEDVLSNYGAHYLTLDVAGRKIYWGNHGRNKIQRANLDGTNVEDLVTGLRIPAGIALDIAQGKIYWVDRGQGGDDRIQRANLDGTNVEDLVTGLTHGASIALGIPQTPVLRLNPNVVADQTFTVGTPVSLTLPTAIGGTPPYTYTLDPIPAGLQFDAATQLMSGTPTNATPATLTTYTATDATGRTASLTFMITVELNLDVNADGKVDVLDLDMGGSLLSNARSRGGCGC